MGRDHYNYGELPAKDQNEYLVPLIKHQMKRNGFDDENENKQKTKIPNYIKVLFEYFCDDKKDHIDLSCINEEISDMHSSLQNILFYEKERQQWKIDNIKLKRIFP